MELRWRPEYLQDQIEEDAESDGSQKAHALWQRHLVKVKVVEGKGGAAAETLMATRSTWLTRPKSPSDAQAAPAAKRSVTAHCVSASGAMPH